MRIAFVGASELAVETANILLDDGHEVVLIELSRDRIDALSDDMDCGFICGDGGKPEILREVAPEQTDVLFCTTNDDKTNVIASVVGKSLGFKRVVTTVHNREFVKICLQLGLKDTFVPARTFARYFADYVHGVDILELSTMVKGDARFFSFVAGDDENGLKVDDLELPNTARLVCFYRDDAFRLPEDGQKLKKGDEIVIITHSENLRDLQKRWKPESFEEEPTSQTGGNGEEADEQ